MLSICLIKELRSSSRTMNPFWHNCSFHLLNCCQKSLYGGHDANINLVYAVLKRTSVNVLTRTNTQENVRSCSICTEETEMNDGEQVASLIARCWTAPDYQLCFLPSICFNLFKHTEAHFILIKIDEMAWNQLSHIGAALTTVTPSLYPQLPLSS